MYCVYKYINPTSALQQIDQVSLKCCLFPSFHAKFTLHDFSPDGSFWRSPTKAPDQRQIKITWQIKSRVRWVELDFPSPPSLLVPSQSPGLAAVQEEIKMWRKKLRWNVNDRHFLSAAFYRRPGNDEFDMNLYIHFVSVLRAGSHFCSQSVIFLHALILSPVVKVWMRVYGF